MQQYLKIVGNGRRTVRDLSFEEASAAMALIVEEKASLPQIAALMAALRLKEESSDELSAFASVLRKASRTLDLQCPRLVDVCVPYDGRSRMASVLPLAALIAAECDAKVGLHGRIGQTTPPKFGIGPGDILAAMGIPTDLSLEAAADTLLDDSVGVVYVDAAQVSPVLERMLPVRVDYGMRSFLNTIEKLINPFSASTGIVGVFHGLVMERVAAAMPGQGYQRGLVVQGPEGAIDVLCSRRTPIIEVVASAAPQSWTIDPNDIGWWDRMTPDAESQVTAESNAAFLVNQIDQPSRDVMLTAALIVYASHPVQTSTSFAAALDDVRSACSGPAVLARLERWRASAARLIQVVQEGSR